MFPWTNKKMFPWTNKKTINTFWLKKKRTLEQDVAGTYKYQHSVITLIRSQNIMFYTESF